MKHKKYLFIIAMVFSLLTLPFATQAQVKIGNSEPVPGAVLDLKQANVSGSYIGGLLLPNVNIADVNVVPATFTNATEINADSAKKAALTGIIVYSINATNKGVYVWNGTIWRSLMKN